LTASVIYTQTYGHMFVPSDDAQSRHGYLNFDNSTTSTPRPYLYWRTPVIVPIVDDHGRRHMFMVDGVMSQIADDVVVSELVLVLKSSCQCPDVT